MAFVMAMLLLWWRCSYCGLLSAMLIFIVTSPWKVSLALTTARERGFSGTRNRLQIEPVGVRCYRGVRQHLSMTRDFDVIQGPEHADDATVKDVVITWARRWVGDLVLCPWASPVLSRDTLTKVTVVQASTKSQKELDQILDAFLTEAIQLADRQSVHQTTLLTIPQLSSDFMSFLSLVEMCEELLEEEALDGAVQLAHFHPFYQFADTDFADVENFTNRSPYPILHLLKAAQIAEASRQLGYDAEIVWGRNVKLMKELGRDKVLHLQQQIVDEALRRNQCDLNEINKRDGPCPVHHN